MSNVRRIFVRGEQTIDKTIPIKHSLAIIGEPHATFKSNKATSGGVAFDVQKSMMKFVVKNITFQDIAIASIRSRALVSILNCGAIARFQTTPLLKLSEDGEGTSLKVEDCTFKYSDYIFHLNSTLNQSSGMNTGIPMNSPGMPMNSPGMPMSSPIKPRRLKRSIGNMEVTVKLTSLKFKGDTFFNTKGIWSLSSNTIDLTIARYSFRNTTCSMVAINKKLSTEMVIKELITQSRVNITENVFHTTTTRCDRGGGVYVERVENTIIEYNIQMLTGIS